MEQRKEPACLGHHLAGDVETKKTSTGYVLIGHLPDGKKMTYTIQSSYLGVEVTQKLLDELIHDGQTELLLFTQTGGQHDYGCIILSRGGVSIEMEKRYLRGRCPVCGGRVIHTSKGYFCEHYKEGDKHACQFHALGILAHRIITEEEMEDFLVGHPEILDGFRTDDNRPFSGFLELNRRGTLSVCNRICRCPGCGGMIYVRPNGFVCEHYYDQDHPCKTFFYRNYHGVHIQRHVIEELVRYQHTLKPLTFYRDDGRMFPAYLALKIPQNRIQLVEQIA